MKNSIPTIPKPVNLCRNCKKPVDEIFSKKICAICLKMKQVKKHRESLVKSMERKKISDRVLAGAIKIRKPVVIKLSPKAKVCRGCWKTFHVVWIGRLCRDCAKLALKAKQTTKKKKSGPVVKSKKALKKKAEELLHFYVRKMAVDFSGNAQCYTCRKYVPFEKTQAGHFRHGKLDLDERNLKACCVTCNLFNDGELDLYVFRLVDDYGKEWLDQLNRDADRDTGLYSYGELLEKIAYYQDKLDKLEK